MIYENQTGIQIKLLKVVGGKDKIYHCEITESYCKSEIGKEFRQTKSIFKKEWEAVGKNNQDSKA